jgi:hypothetical protein
MPNEQTSVPLYTAGEVLTAANMNISAGTGVPVFATTVTRDAAFGGAGEKVLAEGQLCYLSASNIVQYYDGAAWATVGPATASALTFITSATASTAVSSLSVNSCFSATYDNYLILGNIFGSVTSATVLNIRFRVATTDDTSGNYVQISTSNTNLAGPTRTFTASGTAAQIGSTSTGTGYFQATAMYPQAAQQTEVQTNWTNISAAVVNSQGNGSANFVQNTQFDGFTLLPATGTITGTVRVYGYSNS